MAQLPTQLICLVVEYVLNDKKTIEKCLKYDANTVEHCIPIALWNLIGPSALARSLTRTDFDSRMQLNVLRILWSSDQSNNRLGHAAGAGATHIIPYLMETMKVHHVNILQMMKDAASSNQLKTLEFLRGICPNDFRVEVLATAAAKNGNVNVLRYLLSTGEKLDLLKLLDAASYMGAPYEWAVKQYEETGDLLISAGADAAHIRRSFEDIAKSNPGMMRAFLKHISERPYLSAERIAKLREIAYRTLS